MKKKINIEINNCNECYFYKYFRCHGFDCDHPDASDNEKEKDDEPLAENRKGNFPKWCPLENSS